jgi:glycosyltransferase involved in cell wall biosynthesis
MSTLSILIPAYNEEKTIQRILDKVRDVELVGNFSKQLVIVDDCSTDNTEKIIQEYVARFPDSDISYFKHDVNRGKGAALHTGIENATGDYIVIQDADLEYDPQELNLLLRWLCRRGLWFPVHGRTATPNPVFLAYDRKSILDDAFKCFD